jgi:hypothetical protein
VEVAITGVPLGIHGKWGEMLNFMAKWKGEGALMWTLDGDKARCGEWLKARAHGHGGSGAAEKTLSDGGAWVRQSRGVGGSGWDARAARCSDGVGPTSGSDTLGPSCWNSAFSDLIQNFQTDLNLIRSKDVLLVLEKIQIKYGILGN